MDKIVWTMLGTIGSIFEIPRLVIRYTLGLVWTAYMAIRGKNFRKVFSKLNNNLIDDIKWVLDEFKYYYE